MSFLRRSGPVFSLGCTLLEPRPRKLRSCRVFVPSAASLSGRPACDKSHERRHHSEDFATAIPWTLTVFSCQSWGSEDESGALACATVQLSAGRQNEAAGQQIQDCTWFPSDWQSESQNFFTAFAMRSRPASFSTQAGIPPAQRHSRPERENMPLET